MADSLQNGSEHLGCGHPANKGAEGSFHAVPQANPARDVLRQAYPPRTQHELH